MSDLELLHRYAHEDSQAAFATLVDRYLALVYSAAQRQVRSSQLAEEVAQSVFLDLARHATKLRPDQPLAAWLFLVTRRTAVDVVRRESRRQAREQTAVEIAAMKTPSPAWPQVREVVDEALAALNDSERTALLLRFFENRSLREVGASLGISEDTAQKRVNRALDRLRTLLLRRGVAVAAAGLAADLSAQAIQPAPALLGSAITAQIPTASSLAGAALAQATQAGTTTLLSKSLAAAAAAAVLGLVVVQTQAISRQGGELSALPAQLDDLRGALDRTTAARQAAAARLQAARETQAQGAHIPPATDPEVERAIAAWLERLSRMKQLAAERPEFAIPELAALEENDWFTAARDARLDTGEQTRAAFRKLHTTARQSLGRAFSRALITYSDNHDGRLPLVITELAALLSPRLPPDALARYEILQQGLLDRVPPAAWIIAERPIFAQAHQQQLFVTATGAGLKDLPATPGQP